MSGETPRGPLGHRRWRMDYIPDKALFKAVEFSRKMIAEGTAPGLAHVRAARYYGVDRNAVAHFAAQYAGSMGGKKRAKSGLQKPKRTESDNCSTCGYGGGDSYGPYCFEGEEGHCPTHSELASGCPRWRYQATE